MKKILFGIMVILPVFLVAGISLLDKSYFLCPIEYQKSLIIRNDNYGEGFFATRRSGLRLHNGLDLYAPKGTPVLAARFGAVIASRHAAGMGNFIIIRHPGNITTIYGHLSTIDVVSGEWVRQGEVIGSVGKTGNANYRGILPHLHFEVRKGGVPQDPLEYLE
jgi:murein DD-endopeptidase MepM/ murein hydrolase activator NlpD